MTMQIQATYGDFAAPGEIMYTGYPGIVGNESPFFETKGLDSFPSSEDEPRMRRIYSDNNVADNSLYNQNPGEDPDIFTSFGACQSQLSKIACVPRVTATYNQIGKGTYSEVWHCSVVGISQPVAVKVVAQNINMGSCKEVQILKEVNHPNLVRLLDTASNSRANALFLEYCSGGNLDSFLHGQPGSALATYRIEERLKPAFEVSCALNYLHSMEIMHRDIKPSNVFFIEMPWQSSVLPSVKLGDLGLARSLADGRAEMTQGVGTSWYIAPENWGSTSYGKPADVFSVAVLTNELATAVRPYAELCSQRNLAVVTVQVANGVRPTLCDDARIQGMLQACWSPVPEERWSAWAMASNLQEQMQIATA